MTDRQNPPLAIGDTITRIIFFWDENDPDNPGWRAVSSDESHVINDMRVWFPVDVDDYAQDAELASALQAAFPDSEIDR